MLLTETLSTEMLSRTISRLRLVGLGAALLLATACPFRAQAEPIAQAQKRPKPAPEREAEKPVMSFRLGRDPTTPPCETMACVDFIVAEGTLSSFTPVFYEVVAKRLGGRKVPLYLTSTGGSVRAGIRLGEAFRTYDQHVIVAPRKLAVCDPADKGCTEADITLRVAPYSEAKDGLCASACVLALAGATVRHIPAGARVGVHQYFQRDDETKRARVTYSQAEVGSFQRTVIEAAQHLARMGVSLDVLMLGADTPPEKIKVLTRAQLASTALHKPERPPGDALGETVPRGGAPPAATLASAPPRTAAPPVLAPPQTQPDPSPGAAAPGAETPVTGSPRSDQSWTDTPWATGFDNGRPQIVRSLILRGSADAQPLGMLLFSVTCDPGAQPKRLQYEVSFRAHPDNRLVIRPMRFDLSAGDRILLLTPEITPKRSNGQWSLSGPGAGSQLRAAVAAGDRLAITFGTINGRTLWRQVPLAEMRTVMDKLPAACFAD